MNITTCSAMPRGPMKRIIRCCVPEDYYRPLYSLVSAAYILCIFYFWVPIPSVVWDIHSSSVQNVIYGKQDRSSACIIGYASLLFVCYYLVHTTKMILTEKVSIKCACARSLLC